ncbi:glycoside hydrolase family 13 protein [Schleiferilactobacillus harbinensis]|uniref:glycoside hydrolase family 13 protein n=1 Tax=Schleiferilactobacillus harbinensis TaxID=304207 RepID=UPI0007B7AE48|nr:alpha-glucosidase [Schleiferilactobacillus harbinensis]
MAAWYDNAIVYQVYPKSFKDSNGDGIGDLAGITQKLDYFTQLGVNTLWLNPIFQSPQVDNGYDVSDFYAIDPQLGTLADFKALVAAAHARGLRIVLDMVLNHTSDQHPWFQGALQGPDNPYYDYYIWADGHDGQKPNNWGSFFGGSVWTQHPTVADRYYFHLFERRMPDLNWRNPQVRAEMIKVAKYWADLGIDGLRLDAFIHLAKADLHQNYPTDGAAPVVAEGMFANLPAVQPYLGEFVAGVKADHPDLFILGEAASATVNLAADYTRPNANMADAVISFRYFPTKPRSKRDKVPMDYQPQSLDWLSFKQVMTDWQQTLLPPRRLTLYWGNHDMARLATRVGSHRYPQRSAKSLATLMYLQRGLPVLYYGDELGLSNGTLASLAAFGDPTVTAFADAAKAAGWSAGRILENVNATHKLTARAPLPWSDGVGHGFSTVAPWLAVNQNGTPVSQQMADPDSVWHHYQQLFALKQQPLFTSGAWQLQNWAPWLFAYTRTLANETALVLVNTTDTKHTVTLPSAWAGEPKQQLTVGTVQQAADQLTLSPWSSTILTIKQKEN